MANSKKKAKVEEELEEAVIDEAVEETAEAEDASEGDMTEEEGEKKINVGELIARGKSKGSLTSAEIVEALGDVDYDKIVSREVGRLKLSLNAALKIQEERCIIILGGRPKAHLFISINKRIDKKCDFSAR